MKRKKKMKKKDEAKLANSILILSTNQTLDNPSYRPKDNP